MSQTALAFRQRAAVYLILLCSLVFSFAWNPRMSQLLGEKGRIIGRMLDRESGEPLIGGNVMLDSTHYGASTDSIGRFSIGPIPQGVYTLVASYIGYKRYCQRSIIVSADSTVFVLILMEVQPAWSSGALHERLEDAALRDADSLWEIGEPRLLSQCPITVDEKWFADRYRFRFVHDTTDPWIYRRTFNGRMNELMEARHGAIYTNQLHALWERNH